MSKFFSKTKGVISIFLVLILVPMLTCSSLFVDMSKLVLASAVAESAGDLTLNTILTNYDKDLNEYFGLLAACQDIDDVLATMEDYFVSCMVSQDISSEDAENVLEQTVGLANTLNGESNSTAAVSDFLGLSVKEGGFSASKLDKGSLGNPGIFKTQVVEFMKYRAPINFLGSFLDSLTDASTQLDESDEVAEMTEQKQEFYEAENELMEELYNLWKLLKKYDGHNVTEEYVKLINGKICDDGTYEKEYEKIHKKIVFDLHNTKDATEFPLKTMYSMTAYNKAGTYTETVTGPDGSSVTIGDPEKALEAAAKAMKNYLNNEHTFFKACKEAGILDSNGKDVYNSNTVYNLQYWIQSDSAVRSAYENVVSKYNSLSAAMRKLDNTMNLDTTLTSEYITIGVYSTNSGADSVSISGSSDTASNLHSSIQRQYNNISNNEKVTINNIGKRLNEFSKTALDSSKSSLDTNNNAIRTKADEKVKSIQQEITNYDTQLETAEATAGEIIKSAEKVAKLMETYNTEFSQWETAANSPKLSGSTNSMVTTDKEEIAKKKNSNSEACDKLLGKIKDSDVTALKDRYTNIQSLLTTVRAAIEDCKYSGKSIMDIKTIADAIKAANVSVSSFMKTDLDNVAFNFTVAATQGKITSSNNPSVKKGQLKLRDDIYYYFDSMDLSAASSDSKKENKKKYEKIKSDGEAQGEEEDNALLGSKGKELKDIPNKVSADASFEETKKETGISGISTFVTKLFSNFSVKNALVNMRDDLLISDYIMSMFSYDTFEYEGKLDYALEEENYEITTLSAWKTKATELNEKWKTEDKTFSYNKTLRNNLINDANCYSYGNEVEYILYGGSNAKNKSSMYATIYMIRFALDMPLVFASYWGDMEIVFPIASTISAATYGVIPIALIKLAICLGLTAGEAAMDLSYIKSGLGIKLIKTTKDDLFMSLTADGDYDKPGGDEESSMYDCVGVGVKFFQYSDYLRMMLIIKLMGSGESGVCKRTADVVQANIGKITQKSDYKLASSQVYFQVKADVKVDPLLMDTPLVSDSFESALADKSTWNTYHYSMIRGY